MTLIRTKLATVWTALLRLRQVCCDLRLLKLDNVNPANASGKLDMFGELLEEVIDGGHRLLWRVPRVEMETRKPGVGDVAHTIEGPAASVQDQRRRQPTDQLSMDVLEESPVTIRRHEFTGGMVGDGNRV